MDEEAELMFDKGESYFDYIVERIIIVYALLSLWTGKVEFHTLLEILLSYH